MSFADSGFVFDVPDTLANKAAGCGDQRRQKDDATKRVRPQLRRREQAGQLLGSYVTNANAFWQSDPDRWNPVSTYTANVASPAGTVINVNFDDSQGKGDAEAEVNYRMRARCGSNARHDGSGDTAESGDDWVGSVREPPGRAHPAPTQGPARQDASCPVFKEDR